MKLDAVDRVIAVAHGHELSRRGARGDEEAIRERRFVHDERVIARSGERGGETAKKPGPVVHDRRRLAVDRAGAASDLRPVPFSDSLMSEADAEYRHLP